MELLKHERRRIGLLLTFAEKQYLHQCQGNLSKHSYCLHKSAW